MIREKPGDLLNKYRKAILLDENWDLSTLVTAGNTIQDFKMFI
jgi:hypothetical protein